MTMAKRRDENVQRYAVMGDTRPTQVGDTLDEDTLVSLRRAAKAAAQAAKRAERQAKRERYDKRMARRDARRSTTRGGRRDG